MYYTFDTNSEYLHHSMFVYYERNLLMREVIIASEGWLINAKQIIVLWSTKICMAKQMFWIFAGLLRAGLRVEFNKTTGCGLDLLK